MEIKSETNTVSLIINIINIIMILKYYLMHDRNFKNGTLDR